MPTKYPEWSTEELINEFVSSELRVPVALAKEICNRPDSTPYLARIFEEEIYRELGGPGDAWSPIHTLHLLGCIKTPEALHLLIGVLRNRGKELVLDESLYAFVRGAVASALGVIAHNHSECREQVIKLFRQIVRDANVRGAEEADYTFITLLIDDLAQFKDREAFKDIEQAFANERIDEIFINFEDVKCIYQTPDEDMSYHYHHEKDPMDHFSQENIDYLYKLHYDTEKKEGQVKFKKAPFGCKSNVSYS